MSFYRPSQPLRRCASALFWAGLLLSPACNLPRAKLANLREAHQPDGQLSYRGRVQNDMEFALSAALSNSSVKIQGLEGLNAEDAPIADPCGVDLENLNDLADADSSDIYNSGVQVEAFGWLGPDDQYLLGRERAVIELGRAARRLGLEGPLIAPEGAATPEELSGVLAALARGGLGSLPREVEADLTAGEPQPERSLDLSSAIEAIRGLTLDRAGALRVLAVCDVLFLRSDALRKGSTPEAEALRHLALEVQSTIVALALGEALDDPAPLVRAAAYEALGSLPGGAPPGLLQLAATDSEPEVASRGLLVVAHRGLPLERLPEDEREAARGLWIDFLVGQCQVPDGRVSFAACQALTRVVPDGPEGLRPEVWTAWWRAQNPDRDLPLPLVNSPTPSAPAS